MSTSGTVGTLDRLGAGRSRRLTTQPVLTRIKTHGGYPRDPFESERLGNLATPVRQAVRPSVASIVVSCNSANWHVVKTALTWLAPIYDRTLGGQR